MKIVRYTIAAVIAATAAAGLPAQDNDNGSSSSSIVRRRSTEQTEQSGSSVTQRMQALYEEDPSLSEGDLQWMRIIYRQLDLTKQENAALYYPEEPIEEEENLFRIIMRLLANNEIKAYEYLDGREIFSEKYQIAVKDMLDRFHIIYEPARGSNEKNPKFVIQEADVPCNEVLSYYIIEQWTFNNRKNRLEAQVVALCPVLHRAGDFGGEAVKYPMFWVRYTDLRPYLALQQIFVSDDNNLPTCTYDDFFNLTMYEGEIYKTRNLRNQSMAQQYPDPEDRQRAADSIQHRLDTFEDNLWTPTREELAERRAAEEPQDSTEISEGNGDDQPRATRTTRRSQKRSTKVKKPSSSSNNGAPTRSVRRRR